MNIQRRRWLAWLLAGMAMASLILGITFYRPFEMKAGGSAPVNDPTRPELNSLPDGVQTFLVMGVEASEGEQGRADSMVVVSYNPKTQRLAMLSIPRDTWTHIPGEGYDKINHAYAYGGHTLAVDTVERLLGIDINHWVTFSFEGFTKVIDALGGVEMNPTDRLYYVDPYDERMGPDGLVIDIYPGPQVMDGLTALKYSRFRADAEGDLGRMRRQQEVIKAVIKKAASPAMLSRAPQLIPATYSAVGTDLSVGEILKLAATGKDSLSKPLVTGAVEADPYMIDGVFYFGADLVKARTAAYELLVGSPPDEEFVRKAEQENQKYQAALEEAVARSEAAARDAEQNQMAGNQEADPGEGELPETQDPNGPTNPSNEDPSQPPVDGENPTTNPGDKNPDGQGQMLTVNLVDATGAGIAEEYVARIEALGFHVARVGVSSKVLPSTLVVDRVGQPQVEAQFRTVFPDLIYTQALDPYSEQALDVVLGTDLLKNR